VLEKRNTERNGQTITLSSFCDASGRRVYHLPDELMFLAKELLSPVSWKPRRGERGLYDHAECAALLVLWPLEHAISLRIDVGVEVRFDSAVCTLQVATHLVLTFVLFLVVVVPCVHLRSRARCSSHRGAELAAAER
jgi:hypothetical protein